MKYPVNEIFHSLQGEGFHQGRKASFLRLAKCNLACTFCDTDYHSGLETDIPGIINRLDAYDCKSVIVTGGEPTIYPLTPLLEALKENGYWVAIESNGTNDLSVYRSLIDHITISPKQHFRPQTADELRVVNVNYTAEHILGFEQMFEAKHHYISPLEVDGHMNILKTMALLGEVNQRSVHHWSVSLQLHKLAGIR